MTVVAYASTDASAPVLDGTAGSLVAVLTGCLVNGYTGKAAAGWTLSFSAASRGDYRQGGGNQFYLDVDDRGASNGLTGASGQEAAVRGYESMTALGTGTNAFPTTAQVAAATSNWRKSAAASATTRAWRMVADNKSFVLAIADGDSATINKVYYFGDVYSLKSGDGYRTMITVRTGVNSNSSTGTLGNNNGVALNGSSAGVYLARVGGGTGTSANGTTCVYGSSMESNATNTLDSNVYLSRIVLGDGSTPFLRGWCRGVYEIVTPGGVSDGDTFTGTGDFSGKSFVVVKGTAGASGTAMALETSSTWDASS